MSEDPSLRLIHDSDLNQVILAGQGEMQLEIARFRLKERFGVEVALSIRRSPTVRPSRRPHAPRTGTRSRRAAPASSPTCHSSSSR